MKKWGFIFILLISLKTYCQHNDSILLSIFKTSRNNEKITAAYKLANYWYEKKDDSVLYFLDFILNQENIEDDDTIVALAHKLRGNLFFFERKLEKAEKQYIKALEKYKNAKHNKGADASLNNLGLVLIRQNKFDAAINYLKLSIDIARENNDLFSVSKSLHNIGYIYEKKSETSTALEYYIKALKEKRNFNDSGSVANTLNNIGNIYSSNLDYEKALKYYQQSLKINEFLKDSADIAMRLYNIALIYKDMKKYNLATQNLHRALKINQSIKDTAQMATVYNSLGSLQFSWKKNDEAINYYNKAINILNKEKDKIEIARIYSNIGDIHEINGNLRLTKAYYEKAKEIIINTDFTNDKIHILNNYALLLAKIRDYKEAKKIFSSTIKLARESQNPQHIITSLIAYSKLFYYQKKYTIAISVLLEAQERLWKIDSYDLKREVYLFLYYNYKGLKQYKRALQYYEIKNTMEDSIFTKESLKEITELEKKYKLTEKEKEIVLLTQKNKLQELENTAQNSKLKNVTLTRNFAFAGGALLLLLVVISFYAFLTKRKANRKLLLYNAEIIEQKEEILTQRDEIEAQLKHIEEQNELLQTQKTHITDSITYAQYIQKSIFPDNDFLKTNFNDYFVFHQPKDIVSGDFYFGEESDNQLFIGAIDCTGHGVPGAFMSMLGYNALRTIVLEKKITDPAKILFNLDILIKQYTHSSPEIAGNGMDMVLAVVDKKDGKMEISGAKRPIIIAREGILTEIQGTKRSIGRIKHRNQKNFEKFQWQLKKDDTIYMFSDGFADQFGGPRKQKFKYSQLKNKLHEIQNMQLSTQKTILIRTFEEWKGEDEQIDDILVLGIKI
jgi:serine phosphatase RsbU (regulator of sigma subunit)/tetratricopeptide (TPR) repeat protein